MHAKKHICPETIKISYNLQGLWNELSFSLAQHLSTPAGSLPLLQTPKLGRCRCHCHCLPLQAPKSAGLPQLTCSTPRQPLQSCRDELRARQAVQHVAGTALRGVGGADEHPGTASWDGSLEGWTQHLLRHKVHCNHLQPALHCQIHSIFWAFRPLVSDSEVATRKLKNILNCGNGKNRNFYRHWRVCSVALEEAWIDVKIQDTGIKQKNNKFRFP